MSEERVQKILARAGIAARRKAEDLIRAGRVTVNGEVVTLGAKADPARDAIKVDDRRVQVSRAQRYLLLYKPKGCLTAVSDPEGRPTVLDLVPLPLRKALVPVGRLDYQTEGLLLLTDDGDFAQHLAHPRYGCRKTYEVKVKGIPADSALDRLRAGVVLEGKRTAPCRIEPVRRTGPRRDEGGNSWFRVELSEGRTRQIREMFFRAGHPVSKLRRVAIGPLSDTTLAPGDLRELTEREVEVLRRATARPQPRPVRAAGRTPSSPRPRAPRPTTARPASGRSDTRPTKARPAPGRSDRRRPKR